MAIRFEKWSILEFLGVTKEDHEIYGELNSLLYNYAVQKKFWPTKKEILATSQKRKENVPDLYLTHFQTFR